jgi:hypothetical protein
VQDTGRCDRGITAVKPVRYDRWTSIRWTLKQITPPLIARDLNLPTGENPIAEHTNPFVIERVPLAKSIGRAQNFQALLRRKMFLHRWFSESKKTKSQRSPQLGCCRIAL